MQGTSLVDLPTPNASTRRQPVAGGEGIDCHAAL